MKNEFLPVGSVVLLKGGTKRVMITGFCSVDNTNKDIIYDYTGCLYPEGIINSNEICLFNEEQIERVDFRGFSDQEEIDFKQNLSQAVSEYKKENTIEVEVTEESPSVFNINDNIFDSDNTVESID